MTSRHHVRMRKARTVIGPHGEVAHRKPQVGDLSWDGEAWRRWTGRRWTIAAYSLHPDRLRRPDRIDRQQPVDQEARSRALELAVQDQVVTRGATVVHEGPGGVVLGYRKPVSHGFHAVLTIVTGGLWGFVWLALALGQRDNRAFLEADRWGNVWVRATEPG